jgi:hypothetical protein
MFVPLAPAAKRLGVGLRRPCWGQACGGMLRAIARVAPGGGTAHAMHNERRRGQRPVHHDQVKAWRRGHRPGHHVQVPATHNERRREQRPERHDQVPCELNAGAGNNWAKAHIHKNWERFLLNPPCSVAAFVVNSEPRTGARPSIRLCVGPELARCIHIPNTALLGHRNTATTKKTRLKKQISSSSEFELVLSPAGMFVVKGPLR